MTEVNIFFLSTVSLKIVDEFSNISQRTADCTRKYRSVGVIFGEDICPLVGVRRGETNGIFISTFVER